MRNWQCPDQLCPSLSRTSWDKLLLHSSPCWSQHTHCCTLCSKETSLLPAVVVTVSVAVNLLRCSSPDGASEVPLCSGFSHLAPLQMHDLTSMDPAGAEPWSQQPPSFFLVAEVTQQSGWAFVFLKFFPHAKGFFRSDFSLIFVYFIEAATVCSEM